VYLLHFNRYPEAFRNALAQGQALEECRSSLEEAGYAWHLPESGAKIFAHPSLYEAILQAISDLNFQLRPYHVVVSQSMEPIVQEALRNLSYPQGARVRYREELLLTHEEAHSESSSTNQPEEDAGDSLAHRYDVVAKRTFLCIAAPLRNADSISQSTSEIHGGLNPRRFRALDLTNE